MSCSIVLSRKKFKRKERFPKKKFRGTNQEKEWIVSKFFSEKTQTLQIPTEIYMMHKKFGKVIQKKKKLVKSKHQQHINVSVHRYKQRELYNEKLQIL